MARVPVHPGQVFAVNDHGPGRLAAEPHHLLDPFQERVRFEVRADFILGGDEAHPQRIPRVRERAAGQGRHLVLPPA
jgi:hypothetical protein